MSTTQQQHPKHGGQDCAGLWRTNLLRYDLSVPGREMIQSRVDIEPDSSPIRHTHPGEEIIYVLEGSLEYQVDGQPTRVYNAGEALTVPARVIHAVRNTGTGTGTHYRHRGKGQAAPHRGPVNAGWRTAVSTSCPFGQEGSRHG